MNSKALVFGSILMAAAVAAPSSWAAGSPPPAPPPLPTMEFTAFLFMFPWAVPYADTVDPVDVNAIDILFHTFDDPDAFDNPPQG